MAENKEGKITIQFQTNGARVSLKSGLVAESKKYRLTEGGIYLIDYMVIDGETEDKEGNTLLYIPDSSIDYIEFSIIEKKEVNAGAGGNGTGKSQAQG